MEESKGSRVARIHNRKTADSRAYITGLDGIRALAVSAVILYHLHSDWLPGGLLGVGIFFVLSGYLITTILLNGWERSGDLNLKDFWIRRVRRLVPAMLVMIAGTGAWIVLAAPRFWSPYIKDLPGALLYVSNWEFIARKVSYFDSFGPQSPLGHLWSLAVEEQFYLLWPLLLAAGLRYMRKMNSLALLVIILASISALEMLLLYNPSADPSRIYYGTDTRLFSLLTGAALALVWPYQKLKKKVSIQAARILDYAGGGGLLLLGLACWYTNQYQPFLYKGGLFLLSLICAVMIAAIAHPASRIAYLLEYKPLKWIGVRSYGMYLWHYPVIILTTPAAALGETTVLRALVQVSLTVLLAALSWRYVEEPVRRMGMRRALHKLRSLLTERRFKGDGAVKASLLLLAAVIIVINFRTLDARKESSEAASAVQPALQQPVPQLPDKLPAKSGGNAGNIPSITAIGDSVMLDIQPYLEAELKERFANVVIDGKIGRQLWDAADLVNQLRKEGKLGSYVIVEMGTNGAFTKKQMQSLIAALGDSKQILLVNTRVPKPWEHAVNEALADAAAQNPTITLVDWYAASKGKTSYFIEDGVHLNKQGAQALTSLIEKSIKL
ncbi:acyltransferase family protein [Paenibacillus sp. HW567]|uniref:acyltransferase family protein n=1 Tax=Paenibacillus sp. HW567 TaxID=1034769 RepID=UPI000A05B6CA|nr:acyltransferase family protein [Paenibacillus sp. HW567]